MTKHSTSSITKTQFKKKKVSLSNVIAEQLSDGTTKLYTVRLNYTSKDLVN